MNQTLNQFEASRGKLFSIASIVPGLASEAPTKLIPIGSNFAGGSSAAA